MCVREPPPSSSSRTVLRKLLELEGKSQHSWPELLPIPPTPRVEPAKPLLAVCRPSSSQQWTTKARTALSKPKS